MTLTHSPERFGRRIRFSTITLSQNGSPDPCDLKTKVGDVRFSRVSGSFFSRVTNSEISRNTYAKKRKFVVIIKFEPM